MDSPPIGDAESDDALAKVAAQLLVAIEQNLPDWISASVERRLIEAGLTLDSEATARAERAGLEASDAVVPQLRQLLGRDIDAQATTPLSLVRGATAYATAALAEYHVPERRRDAFVKARFPDDVYDLVPSNLSALGDDVGELAIAWGATKAWVHRRRHGAPRDGGA